jgi:hypothetical protein
MSVCDPECVCLLLFSHVSIIFLPYFILFYNVFLDDGLLWPSYCSLAYVGMFIIYKRKNTRATRIANDSDLEQKWPMALKSV